MAPSCNSVSHAQPTDQGTGRALCCCCIWTDYYIGRLGFHSSDRHLLRRLCTCLAKKSTSTFFFGLKIHVGALCALILNRFVLHHSTVALGRLLIIISAGGWMCLRTPGYYRGVIPPLHAPPFSTASHSLHYRNNLVYSVVTCGVTFYAIERLPNLIGAERWPPLPSVWARSGTPWRATHTHTHMHIFSDGQPVADCMATIVATFVTRHFSALFRASGRLQFYVSLQSFSSLGGLCRWRYSSSFPLIFFPLLLWVSRFRFRQQW